MFICWLFGIFPYLFFFKSFLQIKFLILENINKIHFFVLYIEKKRNKTTYGANFIWSPSPSSCARFYIGFCCTRYFVKPNTIAWVFICIQQCYIIEQACSHKYFSTPNVRSFLFIHQRPAYWLTEYFQGA